MNEELAGTAHPSSPYAFQGGPVLTIIEANHVKKKTNKTGNKASHAHPQLLEGNCGTLNKCFCLHLRQKHDYYTQLSRVILYNYTS